MKFCVTDVSSGNVVLVLRQVSGQTEVTDLDQLPLTDQDVPCCQVSVDTLRTRNRTRDGNIIQYVNTQQNMETCFHCDLTFLDERKSMA